MRHHLREGFNPRDNVAGVHNFCITDGQLRKRVRRSQDQVIRGWAGVEQTLDFEDRCPQNPLQIRQISRFYVSFSCHKRLFCQVSALDPPSPCTRT